MIKLFQKFAPGGFERGKPSSENNLPGPIRSQQGKEIVECEIIHLTPWFFSGGGTPNETPRQTRGTYEKNKEIFWEKMPDFWEKIPGLQEKMPGLWEKMPDGWEKMPDLWEKMPDLREKIPDHWEKMPDLRVKIPDGWEKMPDLWEKMPDLWEKMTGLWYNFLGLSLKLNPGKTENRAKFIIIDRSFISMSPFILRRSGWLLSCVRLLTKGI